MQCYGDFQETQWTDFYQLGRQERSKVGGTVSILDCQTGFSLISVVLFTFADMYVKFESSVTLFF